MVLTKKTSAKKTKPAAQKKEVVKKEASVSASKKPACQRDLFVCYYNAFQRYFDFKGRTGRYGYWAFAGVNFLIASVLYCFVLGGIPALDSLYSLLVLIPSWALSVRRLHDINKSGWWIGAALFGVVVLVALEAWQTTKMIAESQSVVLTYVILGWSIALCLLGLYILVLSFFKGTQGKNKYGDVPAI